MSFRCQVDSHQSATTRSTCKSMSYDKLVVNTFNHGRTLCYQQTVSSTACATSTTFGLLYHASSCQQIADVQRRSRKTNSQRRALFCHLHSLISSPCGYTCVENLNLSVTPSQRYATGKCPSIPTFANLVCFLEIRPHLNCSNVFLNHFVTLDNSIISF